LLAMIRRIIAAWRQPLEDRQDPHNYDDEPRLDEEDEWQ